MRQNRDVVKENYAVPAVPVYPFVVEAWLRDEDERERFLDAAFNNNSDMERAKMDVRSSRKFHRHPVPVLEFFGY